jgi:hypothetical protein
MYGMKIDIMKKKKEELKDVPLDTETEGMIKEVENEEDALKQDLLPGRFTAPAINTVLKPLQAFFTSLGIEDFETLSPVSEDMVSPDIASAIMAAVEMINSAVEADVLDEEMMMDATEITDDRSLAMLGARLQKLAKNKKLIKEMKSFLEQPEEETEVEVEMTEEKPVDSEQLFMDRM